MTRRVAPTVTRRVARFSMRAAALAGAFQAGGEYDRYGWRTVALNLLLAVDLVALIWLGQVCLLIHRHGVAHYGLRVPGDMIYTGRPGHPWRTYAAALRHEGYLVPRNPFPDGPVEVMRRWVWSSRWRPTGVIAYPVAGEAPSTGVDEPVDG